MATFRKRAGRWQARVSNIGQSTVSKTFDTKTPSQSCLDAQRAPNGTASHTILSWAKTARY